MSTETVIAGGPEETPQAAAKSSFAEEIRKVTKGSAYKGSEQFDLPLGDKPVDPVAAQAATTPEARVQESKIAPIRIGDKTFTSTEDALNYAREVQAKAQGYTEAIDKLKPKEETPSPAEPDFFEEIEKEFYNNPKEALRKVAQKAQEEARKQVFDEYDKMTKAQQEQALKEQGWKDFFKGVYENNPELSEFKDLVEKHVTTELWEDIKEIPLDQARDKIADRTRELLKIAKGASQKQTVLPDTPAKSAPSTGSPAPVVNATETPTALDFVSQVKANRRKR